MNVDRPTVAIHFVFAFTYCRLKVYAEDEEFVREILKEAGLQEYVEAETSKNWHEVDTRVLLSLTREAFPKIMKRRFAEVAAAL